MKSELNMEIHTDTTELDETIKKANRLVELLREAQQIINSLKAN